jgi:hypothetical protein
MKKKNYELPEEVKQIFDRMVACDELKESYVKRPFGYKKAMRASLSFQELRREFWTKVYNIYPELKKENLNVTYNSPKGLQVSEQPN